MRQNSLAVILKAMEVRPKTAVGVAVLVEKEGSYLLVLRAKRPGLNTWAPPGGRLEFRETFEDCAMREVWEETGLSISRPRYLGVTNDLHAEPDLHGVTIWMSAGLVSGELTGGSPEEVADLRWFPKEELPTELFAPFRDFLKARA